jgi:hypothetical protein
MQKQLSFKPVLVCVHLLYLAAVCNHNLLSKAHAYVAPAYSELPVRAVKPKGWLRHQLQIMRMELPHLR